jgi:hypothetical protein
LGREAADMSPNLRRLIDRLHELDLDHVSSPGIVPLIEDPQDSAISAVLEPA